MRQHVTADHPSIGPIRGFVGRLFMKTAGWTVQGPVPASPKGIFIAAPHTTNWDLLFMLAVSWTMRVRINWMGKQSLFRGVKGVLLRALGGVPVDRNKATGMVAQMTAHISAQRGIYLAVPPSGTRSRRDGWKSGFYHIAREAQVPIICGFVDYKRKIAGVGPVFVPTNDVLADMDRIRDFYQDIRGKYPELESTILIKEEAQAKLPAEAEVSQAAQAASKTSQ